MAGVERKQKELACTPPDVAGVPLPKDGTHTWVYRTERKTPAAAPAAVAVAAEVEAPAPVEVYSYIAIGCGGTKKKRQQHVGKAIQLYAAEHPVDQLHLVGDNIYPGGVGFDVAKAARDVDDYLIQIYGENPPFQVCSVLGNHEEECHGGLGIQGGPSIDEAKRKGDDFVRAHTKAEFDRRAKQHALPDTAAGKYFMPNRYYCQLVFPEGAADEARPSAIIIHLDSSSLPGDAGQIAWLKQLNLYLDAKYPADPESPIAINRLVMLHHSVDFTVGKRGQTKDERKPQSLGRAPKYPPGEGSYAGNHHQQMGRTLRQKAEMTLSGWTTTGAHEHTFSVLEACRIKDPGFRATQPGLQLVVGTGGSADNKQQFKTLAPGVRHTETGYGFCVVRCFNDGSKRVEYYDCPDAAHGLHTNEDGEFYAANRQLRFVETYDKEGNATGFQTCVHPKLIEYQYEWFEVIFSALRTGNLSLCRLALLTGTNCLADLAGQKLPEGVPAEMEAHLNALLYGEMPKSAGDVSDEEAIDSTAIAAFIVVIEKVLHDYAKGQFTESFNQLCALHYVLNQVCEELKIEEALNRGRAVATAPVRAVTASAEETKEMPRHGAGGRFVPVGIGAAPAPRKFTEVVDEVEKRLMTSTHEGEKYGGLNSNHTKKETFLAPGESELSADSDEESDDEMAQPARSRQVSAELSVTPSELEAAPARTTSLRRRRRSAATTGSGRSLELMTSLVGSASRARAEAFLASEHALRLCIQTTFLQFTARAAKNRFPQLLEYCAEEPRYRSFPPALLMAGMASMTEPRLVVAGILAQTGDLNLRRLLIANLNQQCSHLWDSDMRPSEALTDFITRNKSLEPLFRPANARKALGHPGVRNRLYQLAGSEQSIATTRVIGILQRIDELLTARSGYGYAMSNGMASWTWGGCRRSTAWMNHAESQATVEGVCDDLRRARNLAEFSVRVLDDSSKFADDGGQLTVRPQYQADPLLHQLARLHNVLAEVGDDAFLAAKGELLTNCWFTTYSPVPASLAEVRVV